MPCQTHERSSLAHRPASPRDRIISTLNNGERRALEAWEKVASRGGRPDCRVVSRETGLGLQYTQNLLTALRDRGLIGTTGCWPQGSAEPGPDDPTPAEIEAECDAIRSAWPPERFAMSEPPDGRGMLGGLFAAYLRRAEA